MTIRIPQNWLFDFCENLLLQADVEADTIAAELEHFIFEAGEKRWEEYENGDGETIYLIDEDYD